MQPTNVFVACAAGTIEGDVRVSGHPKVQKTFARVMGYVEQSDIHSPNVSTPFSGSYHCQAFAEMFHRACRLLKQGQSLVCKCARLGCLQLCSSRLSEGGASASCFSVTILASEFATVARETAARVVCGLDHRILNSDVLMHAAAPALCLCPWNFTTVPPQLTTPLSAAADSVRVADLQCSAAIHQGCGARHCVRLCARSDGAGGA